MKNPMELVQTNVALPRVIKQWAKIRAEESNMSLQDYLEKLVLADLAEHSDEILEAQRVVSNMLSRVRTQQRYTAPQE